MNPDFSYNTNLYIILLLVLFDCFHIIITNYYFIILIAHHSNRSFCTYSARSRCSGVFGRIISYTAYKWLKKEKKKRCHFPFLAPFPSSFSLQVCPPRWRSRVTQSRKSFSVPTDFFSNSFSLFFFLLLHGAHEPSITKPPSQLYARRIRICASERVRVSAWMSVCVRVCISIQNSFGLFFFFPFPLAFSRSLISCTPDVRSTVWPASYARCSFRGIFIPETCNALETIQNGDSSHLRPPIAWKKPPARKMFRF